MWKESLARRAAIVVTILHHLLLMPDAFCTVGSRTTESMRKRKYKAGFGLANDASDAKRGVHLVFSGGGIFFYWQAGVVAYLREQGYDLAACTFSGASAGALTATLSAGEVDFYAATDLALKLAAKANVWDRSNGLQGVWGPMIHEWLDALLPNSLDNINGRLSLLVTPVPSFGKDRISKFEDKNDLIHCNMASVHIPWFLDGKLTYSFREGPHIDGSFLSQANDYVSSTSARKAIFLDWQTDPIFESRGGLDVVEALSPEGLWGLLEQGKTHGKILEENGTFQDMERVAMRGMRIFGSRSLSIK